MIKQYHILNDCLMALKDNEHDIGTLRIEIQMYRLKRLLLQDEIAKKLKDNSQNEKEFEILRERVLHYSNGGRNASEVVRIMSQIAEMEEYCTR